MEEIKEKNERVVLSQKLREYLGISKYETFEIEKVSENKVIIKYAGLKEKATDKLLSPDIQKKFNDVGIKSEYISIVREEKDHTAVMLKLPKDF